MEGGSSRWRLCWPGQASPYTVGWGRQTGPSVLDTEHMTTCWGI